MGLAVFVSASAQRLFEALASSPPLPLWLILLVVTGLVYAVFRIGLSLGRRSRLRRAHEGSLRSLAGKTAEQWAPYLDGFPGLATEARFLGAPIDYLVFDGLGEGTIREVVFVEVKSGAGKLTPVERSLRDCIEQGRVAWVEHRIDAPTR